MAISLGQFKQEGQRMATSERLAAEYAKQQKKAKKRKGWKGLIGKVAGTGLGAALTGFLGVASGGVLAPLLMAAGQFGGKKLGHELTRGMAAKTEGLTGDKYGYGKGEAKTLAEGLRAQMATDPSKEKGGFGQDVLGSYLSAGLAGELKGAGKAFTKEGKGLGQFLGVGKEFGTGTKGLEGMKAGIGSLFDKPWGGEEDKGLAGTQEAVGEKKFAWQEEDFDPQTFDFQGTSGQEKYGMWDELYPEGEGVDLEGNPFSKEQGGYIPKYYGGGSVQGVNAAPTISEYFNMQGKSLGGSNKHSLAEILGRK